MSARWHSLNRCVDCWQTGRGHGFSDSNSSPSPLDPTPTSLPSLSLINLSIASSFVLSCQLFVHILCVYFPSYGHRLTQHGVYHFDRPWLAYMYIRLFSLPSWDVYDLRLDDTSLLVRETMLTASPNRSLNKRCNIYHLWYFVSAF